MNVVSINCSVLLMLLYHDLRPNIQLLINIVKRHQLKRSESAMNHLRKKFNVEVDIIHANWVGLLTVDFESFMHGLSNATAPRRPSNECIHVSLDNTRA
jgi:site-specific DNA-adenine methylase